MPNWVTNTVVISRTPATTVELKDIAAALNTNDHVFDFNAIVPMPEDSPTFKAEGGLSSEDRQKFGANNWYDWSCENWGTKWNACEAYANHTKNQLVYGFDTAWATPEPVIKALSEKYHVAVKCDYYDEDFGNNIGTYTYVDGEPVSQEDMTEQWDRIAEYFGTDVMEDHGMVNKNGEWVYEED